MNGYTLIIAPTEGFIVKGLRSKLKGIDVETEFATPWIKDVSGKCDDAGLFIFFTDENVSDKADLLQYIKEHCAENNKQLIVIGTKLENETFASFIPPAYIYRFYERPLEMEILLNDMEKYLDESLQQARRKSVLIVDDDVSYMTMISEWLKDKYRVSMVNSGMQALSWLAQNHADLLLLDYEMPVTSGPKVLEMIRSNENIGYVPVMFLTGKDDKDSIMKVLELKPVGYILKSVKKRDLLENIGNFFATL